MSSEMVNVKWQIDNVPVERLSPKEADRIFTWLQDGNNPLPDNEYLRKLRKVWMKNPIYRIVWYWRELPGLYWKIRGKLARR